VVNAVRLLLSVDRIQICNALRAVAAARCHCSCSSDAMSVYSFILLEIQVRHDKGGPCKCYSKLMYFSAVCDSKKNYDQTHSMRYSFVQFVCEWR